MNKYYIGIDVGGTFIKAGVIDNDNNIIAQTKIETLNIKLGDEFINSIMSIINTLISNIKINLSDILGIGIGIPGLIDSKNGIITYGELVKLKDYPLCKKLSDLTNIPVKIANDADVASLAEQKIGAGKNYKNFIMLTLGTGIGGGIVLNGQNLGIEFGLPLEIGHLKISDRLVKCQCGNYGCFESLGSTKALISQTKIAMNENPDSLMWQKYNLESVTGKTVFEFPNDKVAKNVLNNYIKNVGDGAINLINIFKPNCIIIGGAISKQKDNLTKPLEMYVNNHSFLKTTGYKVKIIPAKFSNDAGIIGAKLLFN